MGYQSHTCRVTRSGCQKLNGEPVLGLRVAHSLWQALVNVIVPRFALFFVSSLVLLVLTIRAALLVF